MADLYSPAINITAVKQEPPQSPLPLPLTEPIMQQISFASLVAAIKQELLQPSQSLSSPTIILRPNLAPSTSIMPPSLQPQVPIPTTSLLYPNLVPPPSTQPTTPIPPPPQFRPNLVPPPLVAVKTEPDQQQQELLQPPPSLPLRPPLAPSTPILPPSLQPPTPIPSPSIYRPNLVPPPSLQSPTPILSPSLLRSNLVPPPLAVVKTEPDQPQQELLQPPPSLPPPPIIPRPSLAPSTPIIPPSQPPPTPIPTPSILYPNLVPPPSLQPPTPIPTPSQLRPNLIPPPLTVVKTEPDQPQPPQQKTQFFKSINDLTSLSKSLNAFNSKFEDLTNHIVSINQTIDSKFNEAPPAHTNTTSSTTPPQQQQQIQTQQAPPQLLKSINEPPPAHTNTTSSTTPTPQQQIQTPKPTKTKTPKTKSPPKPPQTIIQTQQQQQKIQTQQPESLKPTEIKTPKTDSSPKLPLTLIQSYCQRMCAKLVRKYIKSQPGSKLREEIPEALKLAPEPAKLVLDCVGLFFVQGQKASVSHPWTYTMSTRKALKLLLDIFGTFHGRNRVIVSVEVKVEAEKVAIGWRKRLIREGGIDNAGQMDARALLLFVAYFGIPRFFSNVDLGYLFMLSKPKVISGSLKYSPFLPCRIPDIIHAMAKNGMHFKALEVASIFGLEGKFSPGTILDSLLPESTKAFEKAQQKARISPTALKKASESHLVALRLTVRCLEDLGDVGTLLLDSWQIKERIVKLEGEIAELDKKIAEKKSDKLKRNWYQMGSSSTVKCQEVKRLRSETDS